MAESGLERVRSLEADQVHAPYGKACLHCARSKTRCASSSSGGKCERCLRLSKDCQPAPTVRKKRVPKRPISSVASIANKTAALEEKLHDIVQLLQHSHAPQSQTTCSISINQAQDQIQHDKFGSSTPDNGIMASSDPGLRAAQNGASCSVAHESHTPAISCSSTAIDTTLYHGSARTLSSFVHNTYPLEDEDEDESEGYLETYRSKMIPFFPIVFIGPEVTVKELREKRPFLWLVIRASCCKNSVRQKALGLEVRKALGKKMLLEGIKSLDLLLGVLVFASWGHFYLYNKPIVTTDIQLGISLASDLGLLKPVPVESAGGMLNYNTQGCPKPPIGLLNQSRTMEERRAVIGLFLISSITANYFQRTEHMRWTPYLDECLRLLEDRKDCPSDELLVYLLRSQLICNRVATVVWTNTFPVSDPGNKVPQDIYVQAFKSQLEELKRTIPPELESNATLQLHVLNTVISIHEHSLIVSPSKNGSFDPVAQLRHIEDLWTCLAATKSWCTIFFSLDSFPISCYPQVSMAIFTQLGHCMVALFRLSTFESPDIPWDRQRVTGELNFGELVRTWAERWAGVPSAAGLDTNRESEEESPWLYTRKLLLVILNWWEVKIAPKIAADANKARDQSIEGNTAMNIFDTPGQQPIEMDLAAMNMDLLDDVWMKDILGGGYEFFRDPYF